MRLVLALTLTFVLCGCARKPPLQSHGQPVAHWLECLQSPQAKTRTKAVVALGHVGTADRAVVPALVGAVKDRDPSVRRAAVLALLNIGPRARAAIPALEEAARDSNAKVRAYAAEALEKVGRRR